jgi:hypothetical protein
MYRLIVVIALSLSFVVTACGGSGKKRVSLKKNRPDFNGKASEKTKGLNAALTDASCLRVDKLIKAMMQLKDENVLVYTADANVGNFETAALRDVRFLGEADVKIRAASVIKKGGLSPLVEFQPASELQKGSIKALMSLGDIDTKCEIASVPGVTDTPNFNIVKKTGEELWMKNIINPNVVLRYQYNRVDKLTISEFRPKRGLCGRSEGLEMTKYVVAREGAMKKVDLDRGYAEALASVIDAPAPMTQALAQASSARSITLTPEVMATVRELLNSDTAKTAACP